MVKGGINNKEKSHGKNEGSGATSLNPEKIIALSNEDPGHHSY